MKSWADRQVDNRDPDKLQYLIHASEVSANAWDVLQLKCREWADRGEGRVPDELLEWYFWANHGHPERSEEGSGPGHRNSILGIKLRNNEIKHDVSLLVRVGMQNAAACRTWRRCLIIRQSQSKRACQHPADLPARQLSTRRDARSSVYTGVTPICRGSQQ